MTGALWRLSLAAGGKRVVIAAAAVAAIFGVIPRASASVEYDYTGSNFTKFAGDKDFFTMANSVTGSFVFNGPLASLVPNVFNPYSSATGLPPPFAFTIKDG